MLFFETLSKQLSITKAHMLLEWLYVHMEKVNLDPYSYHIWKLTWNRSKI